MKQSMLHIFRGTAAKESLVDDAVKTNETAETTDPVQAQNNVDFQEEIKRLKDLKNVAPAEGGDAPPVEGDGAGDDAPSDGDETSPAEGDDAKPVEEDKPAEETDEKPADGEEEVEPVETTDEESEESPEEATDVKPVKDLETATEALHFAIESLRLVRHAHDVGVVRPYHVNMVLEGISHHSKRYGFSSTGFATEADAPDSSMGKVKLVAGKVAEFIRNLIKQIQEYFGKVLAWLKEAYRGYKGQQAQFEKTTAGMLKRMEYLKGQTIDQDKLDKAVEAKTIQLAALTYGGENTYENVVEGARVLTLVSAGINHVVEEIGHDPFLNTMLAASFDNEPPLLSIDTCITPASAMKMNGATSVFGNDKVIHDNLHKETGNVTLNNLIGGITYAWLMSESAATNLDEAIGNMIHYNFKTEVGRSDNSGFKPLKTVDECTKALMLVVSLQAPMKNLYKLEADLQADGEILRKASEKYLAETVKNVPDEQRLSKYLALISAAPQAFVRLKIGMVIQHIKHITNVQQQLQRWVSESVEVIASAVATKP